MTTEESAYPGLSGSQCLHDDLFEFLKANSTRERRDPVYVEERIQDLLNRCRDLAFSGE